ncbi:MAG: murein L,D-transpeptidase YafK [Gammaproteobacteria bacterium]
MRSIQQLDHQQAMQQTRELLREYPHSRLGQMLFADLLLAKAAALPDIGGGLSRPQAQSDFQHEIKQRLEHSKSPAHQGLIPGNIIFLAEKQPYVIIMDQKNSRLYVYRNDQGTPLLETDYFVTIGLKGYGKEKRGDQKTPIGVYHVTRHISDEKLPDLYGRGAFPISYPNVWDRRLNRTGGGIWIHGTPSYTYNRSPWASNGCIVVSNPDFGDLGRYVNYEINTPVIVTESIDWITNEEWQRRRKNRLTVFSRWVRDWESLDHNRYRQHYSQQHYIAEGRDFKKWDGHKKWVNRKKTHVRVDFSNLNVFEYPGEQNLMLIQYQQDYDSNNLKIQSPKELFWRLENNQWRIVYEGTRTFPVDLTDLAQN